MCESRWGVPPEKSQNIGFLSNTGPDPLKNLRATKPEFNVGIHLPPAFNVGPSSAASETPFKWLFSGGPMMALF